MIGVTESAMPIEQDRKITKHNDFSDRPSNDSFFVRKNNNVTFYAIFLKKNRKLLFRNELLLLPLSRI